MIAHRVIRALSAFCLAFALSPGFGGSFAFAQEEHATSTGDLAKAAQNPIADMISVPLQSNFNFHVAPHDQLQYVLNIQPVVPVALNAEWNLITRWITPREFAADVEAADIAADEKLVAGGDRHPEPSAHEGIGPVHRA